MKIKGFDKNLCCRGMQYEVGKEYKTNVEHITKEDLCSDKVLHYCDSLQNVHNYYNCHTENKNRYCEIEVLGDEVSDGEKFGSNYIKIIREIAGDELAHLRGLERGNTGLFNSGDRNSGDRNSGDLNSGDRNGGNRNSGDQNSGNRNSGYLNSGDLNSGDRNSGDLNSGDLNSGYRNSGVFCTKKREDVVTFFNKESNMTWNEWYRHAAYQAARLLEIIKWITWADMTDKEKKENPSAYVCGGYIKVFEYKEAWGNLWKILNGEQKNSFKTLPNFDASIFEEITGIKIIN